MTRQHPLPEQPGAEPGMFQVLTEDGELLFEPDGFNKEVALRLYKMMARVRHIDERMVTLQRQGRVSFYGSASGQEAAVIGSGYGLRDTDWVLPALREGGIALLRGMPLSDYVNQVFGNGVDIQGGRQMPCHYGHKDYRYVTLSSVIANQLPHAIGVALAAKARGEDVVAAAYMGDGATSEGDFHTTMEFAARLNARVLFFCQNNQWAISTGVGGQTAARTMASKAHGYSMDGYRLDGNDILAVWLGTRYVTEKIRESGRPAFIEALTYRVGAHSTSDDPSRYRDESITDAWRLKDPILRMRKLVDSRGWWSDAEEEAMQAEYAQEIRAEIERAEAAPAPTLESLFSDVYAEIPWHLKEQQEALKEALSA